MAGAIKVLLIDDHPLYRAALIPVVHGIADAVKIFEAGSIAEAFTVIDDQTTFDLVLLDLSLPDASGLKALFPIYQLLKDTPIVVISANEDRKLIANAISAGAKGYIPKSAARHEIRNALILVLSGSTYIPAIALDLSSAASIQQQQHEISLTRRQHQVLQLMAQGFTNKLIAQQLQIAETTVRVHVSDVIHQLTANNRTDAVIKAQKMGLIDLV